VFVFVLAAAFVTAREARGETIHVPAGGNLQAAIDQAKGGDVITLAAGVTYTGNFVLRNKPGVTTPIVIKTADPAGALPRRGVRITPVQAPLLAKIKSGNAAAALRTETAAHHWTLELLEFQANLKGYNDIISLGAGDTTQTDLAQVPYALVLDRLYIHGDPLHGQKRGIALHSRDTAIINSYVTECKGIGQDTQAISGFNGPGNYLIENNYLEGAGENFMIGGADPTIPNLVPAHVVFRRNHLRKPLEWRSPIVPTPSGVAASPVPGGGVLPGGTYSYKVVARRPAGQANIASSDASAEVTAAIGAGGAVTITWQPVPDAQEYFVYGRTSGAINTYWTTTSTSFTDTGAAGTAGTPVTGTRWVVKNLFELKSGQDITIEGNVFENLWIASQSGYAIVFTPRNQSGRAPWTVLQRITFRDNLVRHSAGGVNILGRDDLQPSLRTNHIDIVNNVFEDLTASIWGTGSRFLLIGDGPDSVTIDHNTVITTNSSLVWLYGGPQSAPTAISNSRYTNNLSAHNRYGIMGQNYPTGTPAINAYLPDGVVSHNVLAGGSASGYPTPNFFPTVAAWESGFVNFAAGNYRLAPTSPYNNAGSDGIDIGADVDKVTQETAVALSGDNTASELHILTTALPVGQIDQPYAFTLACSADECEWTIGGGALHPGLALDPSGVINGTPTSIGTQTWTVEAFDRSAPFKTASRQLTLTINPGPFVISVPTVPVGMVGNAYQVALSATGAFGNVSWSIASGSLPPGLHLHSTFGAISGVPTTWGASSAEIEARDSWGTGRADRAAVTITVAPVPLAVAGASLGTVPKGAPFSKALVASGGTGATTWQLASGSLPAGVALAPNGVLSGSPTATGTFVFAARATDVNWPSYVATATFTLVVTPPAPTDVVLYAANGTPVGSRWRRVADSAAAGGYRMANPNVGAPKLAAASATPSSYFELTFTAQANLPYHLWLRGRAENNSTSNDSVFIQFSASVDAAGLPFARIGTTSAQIVALEDRTNAGVSGWGWADNAYGALGAPIVFATSGVQKLRVQAREDGLSIDQIVLSPGTYATRAPGSTRNDRTILPATAGGQ
jgi:hypothetical protein